VIEGGRWPDVVDVPTGLGKTSLIDVAVFAAAARPAAARRRVFFVVDRRLVVDEAYEHARRLQRALRTGATGVCGQVARALRQDGDDPDAPALEVTRMRGGLTWSWRWLERPDRHAVVAGTVDQVGSRLLFRGYGGGERLRPIDAALTGRDSLIIVDEAHLAGPFTQTLRDAAGASVRGPGQPPVVVTMPGHGGAPARRPRAPGRARRRAEPGLRPADASRPPPAPDHRCGQREKRRQRRAPGAGRLGTRLGR
jgi:CRISPR-associated endonuclease/helicase Cas3